jgi:hypothetical protein
MQSQETSRRVRVSRDGRQAAIGSRSAAYLLNVSARVCSAARSNSDILPIVHARATRRWCGTTRSFDEFHPRSSPLAANLVPVEFWSNPGRSVDRDLAGLAQNASKIPAFLGDAGWFLRSSSQVATCRLKRYR